MREDISKIIEEFEENAVEATGFKRITEEIKIEEIKRCYPHPPGYLFRLKRNKDWNTLGYQVEVYKK